jgi:hypothetical protein
LTQPRASIPIAAGAVTSTTVAVPPLLSNPVFSVAQVILFTLQLRFITVTVCKVVFFFKAWALHACPFFGSYGKKSYFFVLNYDACLQTFGRHLKNLKEVATISLVLPNYYLHTRFSTENTTEICLANKHPHFFFGFFLLPRLP